MKIKNLSYLFIGLLVGCLFPIQSLFAEQPITLIINGKTISNASPQIISNRTYVPLRVISEELGATVEWDGVNRVVRVNSGKNNQNHKINQNINNKVQETITNTTLNFNETYTNEKIKIKLYDLTSRKSLNEDYLDYKIKLELLSDDIFIGKTLKITYITDKYGEITTNTSFGTNCDVNIQDFPLSVKNSDKYKIKAIKIDFEPFDTKNIIWNIN